MIPGPHPKLVCALAFAAIVAVAPDAQSAPTTTVDLVMGDGVGLTTDIYAPHPELRPVILIRTPYDRSAMELIADDLAVTYNATVFVQDVRGRGDSSGVDTVFRDDAKDGRETLDWIELLGWSNGTVGSWGSSVLGITQMLMAPGASDLYQCQYTTTGTHAIADQVAYRGGVRRRDLDTWLSARDAVAVIGQWDAHPDPAAPYWEEVSLTAEKVATINTAGVHVSGWYDAFLQGAIDYFAAVHESGGPQAVGRQHLLIGPWTHSGEDGDVSFPEVDETSPLPTLESAWAEGCLGSQTQVFDELPSVYLYVMGDTDDVEAPGNGWEAFLEWPPPSNLVGLYLREADLLDVSPPLSAQPAATYIHDPTDPVPTLGGNQLMLAAGPVDQTPIEAREDVAVFTTEPLVEPVEIIGRVRARLWLSSLAKDSQVVVRLTDVYPDGRSILIASGIAAYEGTGAFAPVEVDLWSTAMIFNAGHQIRVSISGASADAYEVAPQAFTAQIGRSSSHPSRLELPLRSGLPDASTPVAGVEDQDPEPTDTADTTGPSDAAEDTGHDLDVGPIPEIDTGTEDTTTLPGADAFGADTTESSSGGGGGGDDGCASGPASGPWFVFLGLFFLVTRCRSRSA